MKGKDLKEVWFPTKKYGFGWGLPVKWQGWVVLLVYIFLIIIGSIMLLTFHNGMIYFLVYVLILTLLLIYICWKKGERPRWRWGDKK